MEQKQRIGLIGVGGIMNSTHIKGYLQCPDCEITAICDLRDVALENTGKKLGIPEERRYHDYHDLLNSGVIDAVDIATSNDAHVEIALAALDAGFPVSIEKPIGMNFAQAAALSKKSKETGLPVFVCFSWRYNDYPRFMKKLIDEGNLGKLYHIYVTCIKDSGLWVGRRLEWRFQEDRASSGVLCDLGSHMFDMVRFFGEEFESVACNRGTIVKRRQMEGSDEWADVTTDDWSNVICTLKSGVSATVKLTRCATNVKNYIEFFVMGEKGSLRFIHDNGKNQLLACLGENNATNTFVPLEIPDDCRGALQSRSYVNLLNGHPDVYASLIDEGLGSQAAVDAAKLSSQTGRFITIRELYESVGLPYDDETEKK